MPGNAPTISCITFLLNLMASPPETIHNISNIIENFFKITLHIILFLLLQVYRNYTTVVITTVYYFIYIFVFFTISLHLINLDENCLKNFQSYLCRCWTEVKMFEDKPASLSKYSSGNSVIPTLGSISIANKLSKPFTLVGTLLNF